MHPEILFAYLMGIACISFGLLALISPSTAAELFGVELHRSSVSDSASTPSSPHSESSSAVIAGRGARDITIGLCYLTFGFLAEFRAIRVVTLAHMIAAVVDVFVTWRYSVQSKEKKTWIYGVGTAGLVVALTVAL
jgi:hypothetical protein